MTTEYPIPKTQAAIVMEAVQHVQRAQAALNGLYTIILAGHDVTANGRCYLKDETTLVLEQPDVSSPIEEPPQ